jgi:hypothetical protein
MVSAGIALTHSQEEKANRQTSYFFPVACSMTWCSTSAIKVRQQKQQQQQLQPPWRQEKGLSVAETAL